MRRNGKTNEHLLNNSDSITILDSYISHLSSIFITSNCHFINCVYDLFSDCLSQSKHQLLHNSSTLLVCRGKKIIKKTKTPVLHFTAKSEEPEDDGH